MDVWNFSDFLEQHAVKWTYEITFWSGGRKFCFEDVEPKRTQNGPKMRFFSSFFFVEKAVHKPLTLEQLKGLKLIQMILSDSFLVELEEVG